jgi:ADP-ribose pyrophosphatase YjhB (NUDIX family)
MDHQTERGIILKLIHKPSMTFNELWGKEGESNTFAYHLNKLVEQGMISKNGEGYSLTIEGHKLAPFIEGDTGEKAAFPTLVVIIMVVDGDRILGQKRLKEPYYGTLGLVGGKINFGQNAVECALRDLTEETDLIADEGKLIGIEQIKTYQDGELLHHHYVFAVRITSFTGTLKEKTHKAENMWMTSEEYQLRRASNEGFPETTPLEEWVNGEKFWIAESERQMEDGKFVSGKLLNFEKV